MTSLEGQRIVVVGGTSGMGLATVRAAAGRGADVIAAGRRPVGDRAGPRCRAAGGRPHRRASVGACSPPWASWTTCW